MGPLQAVALGPSEAVALKQVERGLDALPHLEKLGSALWEKYRERQSQKRSEALAVREAEYVSALATELMDAEDTGFRTRLESVRAVIHDSLGAAGSLASDLDTALSDLDARSARLRDAAREYAAATW